MDKSWTEDAPPAPASAPVPPAARGVLVVVPGPEPTLVLTAPPAEPPKKRSPGMIAAGGVLTGLGVANLAVGFAVFMTGFVDQQQWSSSSGSMFDRRETDRTMMTVGGATMVGGGALLAVGIPLIVLGLRKRPVEPAAAPMSARVVPRPSGLGIAF